MQAEAAEAPAVVARQLAANDARVRQLAARLRARPPRAVVTCARGSSYHATTFAKYVLETRLGVLTSAAAPSVASLYDGGALRDDVLFLAISQSGRSPDLLAAATRAPASRARASSRW
jgi:glutamine---fructose-6-phosphate transaminase (isomerizing)